MPERRDPVIDLLDHADHLAPVMVLDPDSVVEAGRRKVRRRRVSATGVGALALAGALWLGGPLNPFAPTGPTPAPAPAAVSWQDGVDVELFDNSPNAVHEPDRTHWVGELRSGEGDERPELVLTRDGEMLAPVPAQDGPGDVMLFRAEGVSVAVWQSPEGSLGEWAQWAPGKYFGQGADITVDDATLRYSVAEFVPGASGELVDLYWFDDEAAHAASGDPVVSTVLTSGDSGALLMLDEAKGVWGVRDLASPAGLVHVEPLVAGSGMSGWTGEHLTATTVGVLPPGASTPSVDASSATLAQAPLGPQTAVLAVDTTGEVYGAGGATAVEEDGTTVSYAPPPAVRFTLDGEERVLESYAQDQGRTLAVGSVQTLVTAQPDGLSVRRGESVHVIPAADLADGRALTGTVRGGQVVVVPGWEPDAEPEDLRVLVGSGGDERWVTAKSAYVDALFDGRPLAVLGLDLGALREDESVLGVGVADGDEVVRHALPGGVVEVDLGL